MANHKKHSKPREKRKPLIILLIVVAVLAVGAFVAFRIMNSAHVGVDNDPEMQVRGEKRVLVAYFSWSGNLRQMARWTAEETGGELFRIVPEESYGTDYSKCAARAKKELDNGVRPALSQHIPPEIFANYDVIYLGYPVWWYDLPMPVWSFLEEYDLSGKTVIPFFSHNGSSNGANSLSRISELAKAADAVYAQDAISVKDGNVASSETQVKQWAGRMLEKAGHAGDASLNTESPAADRRR